MYDRRKSYKINNIITYSMLFALSLTIGATFYINYKLDLLTSVQKNSIKMFAEYANKDLTQQKNINDLNLKIDQLSIKLNKVNDKINNKFEQVLIILHKQPKKGN